MTVWDAQGNVYDAVQVTTAGTSVNGRIVPVGWWIVTNAYGKRSEVSPQSFLTMFTPAQGTLQLGQPGGAASLNRSGLVEQHSAFEGDAFGTATLDQNGDLVETGNLATINAAGKVVQDPASYAQANGGATLDANKHLVQTSGLVLTSQLGAASGIPTLDANQRVTQGSVSGIRHAKAWQFTNGSLVFGSASPTDLYTASDTDWTGSDVGPFSISSGGGLILARLTIAGIANYYANLTYTLQIAANIDNFASTVLTHVNMSGSVSFPTVVASMLFSINNGVHTIHFTAENVSGASGNWTVNTMLVEVEILGDN